MNKFMKNNLKVFIAIVATTVIVSGISVYATSRFLAKEIAFTPSNENKEKGFDATNVDEALNELYQTKVNSNIYNFDDISYSTGNLFMGTRQASKTLSIDLNKGEYILFVNDVSGTNSSTIRTDQTEFDYNVSGENLICSKLYGKQYTKDGTTKMGTTYIGSVLISSLLKCKVDSDTSLFITVAHSDNNVHGQIFDINAIKIG